MDIVTRINWLIEQAIKGMERPYSLSEAAAYLHMSKSQLYKLTSANKITHYKPNGKRIFLKRSDLDAYAFSNKQTGKEQNKVSND